MVDPNVKSSLSAYDRAVIGLLVVLVLAVLGISAASYVKFSKTKAAEPTNGASTARQQVTVRPISDYLSVNYPSFNVAEHTLLEIINDPSLTGYVAIIHEGPLATDNGSTQVDGYIVERTQVDGSAVESINITGDNAPVTVYRGEDIQPWVAAGQPVDATKPCWRKDSGTEPDNKPCAVFGDGLDGKLSYSFDWSFVLPTPGQPLLNFWEMLTTFPEENERYIAERGTASGTFTPYAEKFGFKPGSRGKLIISINLPHVGVNKSQLSQFRGALGDEVPAEIVNLIQL